MNYCSTSEEQCSEIQLTFKSKFGYRPPDEDYDLYCFSTGWFSGIRSLLAELADELTTSILYNDIHEISAEIISEKVNLGSVEEDDVEAATRVQVAAFIYDLLTEKQKHYENASCKF